VYWAPRVLSSLYTLLALDPSKAIAVLARLCGFWKLGMQACAHRTQKENWMRCMQCVWAPCFSMKKVCCVCCPANGGAIVLQEVSRPPSLLTTVAGLSTTHFSVQVLYLKHTTSLTVASSWYHTNLPNSAKLCFSLLLWTCFVAIATIFFHHSRLTIRPLYQRDGVLLRTS
jgi:hypothetical protein